MINSTSVSAQSKDKKANAIVKEMVLLWVVKRTTTHFIQWDFVTENFWDKWTGDVRVEILS
jgi:hypothetical protein